jgi:hypothetical protein
MAFSHSNEGYWSGFHDKDGSVYTCKEAAIVIKDKDAWRLIYLFMKEGGRIKPEWNDD